MEATCAPCHYSKVTAAFSRLLWPAEAEAEGVVVVSIRSRGWLLHAKKKESADEYGAPPRAKSPTQASSNSPRLLSARAGLLARPHARLTQDGSTSSGASMEAVGGDAELPGLEDYW